MSKDKVNDIEPKFTKGEKCIFTHLVLTFTFILILVIIYAIHLFLVQHTFQEIFITRRSYFSGKGRSRPENILVGYLFINLTVTKFVCNTLLLKSRWSLCTAHCVAVRTDPDMAHLLFAWGLKYKLVPKDPKTTVFITPVRRSIAHSLFNRETFANNIGLLEHAESYPLLVPNFNDPAFAFKTDGQKKIFVIGWNQSDIEVAESRNSESTIHDVQLMGKENCLEALSPVNFVRNYEYCATFQNERNVLLVITKCQRSIIAILTSALSNIYSIGYGAVVFANSKVIGIFSWGERIQKDLPMIMINITLFEDWLKYATL